MATNPVLKTNSDNVQLYEVIRIIEGTPIFLEDHLDRLYHSAQLTGVSHLPDSIALEKIIKEFLIDQKRDFGNIKLTLSFSDLLTEPQRELVFIPHYYPTNEEYINGVKVGVLYADRKVPQAKVQQADIRERANRAISENNLFEVLLIDSEGNITEGSRSNVFFIQNGTLYSAPEEKILQGITRMKVLQLCETSGVPVIRTAIVANEIHNYEAAIITGTSPKILPISTIDNVLYKTDIELILKLQKFYNQLIANYISERR